MRTFRFMTCLCCAILVALAAGPVLAGPHAQESALRYGDRVEVDMADPAGDLWTFSGTAGDFVVIQMGSSTYDCTLELRDAAGTVLASSQLDESRPKSANIFETLPATGAYTVLARTVDNQLDRYRISLILLDWIDDLPPLAITLDTADQVVPLKTIGDLYPWVSAVDLSRDGSLLAAGLGDTSVRVWDTQTWDMIGFWTDHSAPVRSIAFSPDGSTLASGAEDASVMIWDIASSSRRARLQYPEAVTAVAWSPTGRYLIGGSADGSVLTWDLSGEPARVYQKREHESMIVDLVIPTQWETDDRLFYSGDIDGLIHTWRINTGDTVFGLDPMAGNVLLSLSQSVWRQNQSTLAGGLPNGGIALWDVSNGAFKSILTDGHSAPVNALAFSPTGKLLASGGADGSIVLWSMDFSGSVMIVARLDGHTASVNDLAWSSDSLWLVSASDDNTVIVWGVRD